MAASSSSASWIGTRPTLMNKGPLPILGCLGVLSLPCLASSEYAQPPKRVVSAVAHSECGEILGSGVWNESETEFNSEEFSSFANWLCRQSDSSYSSARSRALNFGIPIKGFQLSFGGTTARQNFASWRTHSVSSLPTQTSHPASFASASARRTPILSRRGVTVSGGLA